MKKFRYILLLLAASTMWGCVDDLDNTAGGSTTLSGTIVELTEDGRYQVTAQLEGVSMTSVVTRATTAEDAIHSGWCLVFGEDEDNFNYETGEGTGDYSDESPLLQIEPVTVNANGTFTMVFDEYPHAAFMRIVVNLTDRENTSLENIVSWRKVVDGNNGYDASAFLTPPTDKEVSDYGIGTFGTYRYQSVGLDGIYDVTYKTAATITEVPEYTDLTGEKTTTAVVYTTEDGTALKEYYLHGQLESYNTNQPSPANVNTDGFPMSSYGFVLNGISEESLKEEFGTIIYMIRTCSKVQVEVVDDGFVMEEVYLIDAAQESRIRSTVMSTIEETGEDGEISSSVTSFNIPVDLGGTINYEAQTSFGTSSDENPLSDPIYFYPNSGGNYEYEEGVVDQDINPQYIIIKGQASGYDTPGYYKVALKATYPLDNTYTTYSDLTYDILRNTSFTVKLESIEKPGYKTFEDAADVNSPANNISYSIVIETSDNRYEVLVSNGTYYVELETSRVYVKGYMEDGLKGCYLDFAIYPTEYETDEGTVSNYVPTVYVQSSDHDNDATDDDVAITHCLVMHEGDTGYDTDDWTSSERVELTTNETGDGLSDKLVKIVSSNKATKVRVYYDVTDSGRIRIRIGDMLKFIPVVYDHIPISVYGTKGQNGTVDNGVVVEDDNGTVWSDFSYSEVTYDTDYEGDENHEYKEGFELNSDGTVTFQNIGDYDTKPELRARILPTNAGDGNAVLYLRQASDFAFLSSIDGLELSAEEEYSVIFNSQSVVKENNTGGLFVTNSDGKSVTCDLSTLNTSSVDEIITVSISNEITTSPETKDGDVGSKVVWGEFFNEEYSNYSERSDGYQTLTLTADVIDYDITDILTDEGESTLDVSDKSGTAKGTARQAWLETYIRPYLVTYNNTAISTVKITNVAGDYKEYTVNQTQYPPLYLIDASGEDVKCYSFDEGTNGTSYATLFAVNVWNSDLIEGYSSNTGTYGYSSSYLSNAAATKTYPFVYSADYAYNYHKNIDSWTGLYSTRSGQKAMRRSTIKPHIFNSSFISQYNWDSGTDKSNKSVSTSYTLGGTSSSVTPAEMWLIGADQYADAIIGIVRNTAGSDIGSTANVYYAMMEITISVRDIHGDIYTTEKKLCGKHYSTSGSFTYPTGDTWDSRWKSFTLTDTSNQEVGNDYDTY